MGQNQEADIKKFKESIEKIENIGKEIDDLKGKQFNALKKASANNIIGTFKRWNQQINQKYKEFSTEIHSVINNDQFSHEQGSQIVEIADKFYKKWIIKIEDVKKYIHDNIKTKIGFIDLGDKIFPFLDENKKNIEEKMKKLDDEWGEIGDYKVIDIVKNAFKREQIVANKLPYNKDGELWKTNDIVTKQELGIEEPLIPEVELVKFQYQIDYVDLDQSLVEVRVYIILKNAQTFEQETLNVKIRGYIDKTKFDHLEVLKFIDKFGNQQTTKHKNQSIFNWKIGDKENIDANFLGIVEPENNINIKLVYRIVDIDYSEGIVTVKLDALKHDVIISHDIKINGFYQAKNEIMLFKEYLEKFVIEKNTIDLKHTINYEDTWMVVVPIMTDYWKNHFTHEKGAEMIDNLTFGGEGVQCDDMYESIVHHADITLKIISKTIKITLGHTKIGTYRFEFINHLNLNAIGQKVLENLADKFDLYQNTRNPNTIDVFGWKENQSEGIDAKSLGINEPENFLQAKYKYKIVGIDYFLGKLNLIVEISANNHRTKREIVVANFVEVIRITNKFKRDFRKFEKNSIIIDLQKSIWPSYEWKDTTDLILSKIKNYDPFRSYSNDQHFFEYIHLSGDEEDPNLLEKINKTKNFDVNKTAKTFNLKLNNAYLGKYTFYFKGFKKAPEKFVDLYERDKNGEIIVVDGVNQYFKLYLETGPTDTINSIKKTIKVIENVETLAGTVENFKNSYREIHLNPVKLKIKWHEKNIDRVDKVIIYLDGEDFRWGKELPLYDIGYQNYFAEQYDHLTVKFDIIDKALFLTVKIDARSKNDVWWIYTNLEINNLELVPY